MILPLFILLLFSGISCKKSNPEPEPDPNETPVEFLYDSLIVSASQVYLNDVVDINAYASGKDLTYTWTIDVGALLGSGSTVTFSACCQGIHNITCTIEDAYGNSESKSVTIKVL